MSESSTTELLTLREAAKLLRVSRKTVYRYLSEGKLPGLKTPGGVWRVKADSVHSLFRAMNGGEHADT